MEAAKGVSKQLMNPTFFLVLIGLVLLSLILTSLVNSKVDGVSNEKISIGKGRTGAGATTANEITWVQPKNTILTNIRLVCTSAVAVASGDIGVRVGTTTGGGEIVAAGTADQILDAGTVVPVGATYDLTLVATAAGDAAPAANPSYTTVKRTLYFGITHTTTATDQGYFSWLVEYQAV